MLTNILSKPDIMHKREQEKNEGNAMEVNACENVLNDYIQSDDVYLRHFKTTDNGENEWPYKFERRRSYSSVALKMST